MTDKYGSYRTVKLVGSDSYGKLYEAYDETLDRPAALKVLPHGLSDHPEFIQRFRKNMQTLAQLNHPRIPQVYFFGREGEEHFVALEWCIGGSLANQLRNRGRMPLPKGIRILLQCIDGLAAAWKLGIAHGNLKPNNLLITDSGEIKISDFGLIPERPADLEVRNYSGALSFMAPELGDQRPIDFRADIYSLGVIFHYMLLNSLPSRSSPEDSSSGQLAKSLPIAVYRVIDRMTKEDPRERYDNYEDLILDIKGLTLGLSDEPLPLIPRAVEIQEGTPLKVGSLFDMLASLYRQEATGVMKVSWLALQKRFLIRRGEIVFLESTQPNERVESLLDEKKWISKTEFSTEKEDANDLIHSALLNAACSREELRAAYGKLLKDALLQIFHWPVFEGEFFAGRIENEPLVSLRLPEILLEASRNIIDSASIKQHLPDDHLIKKTPSFEQLLAPFPLTPEESFLAYRLEGEDLSLDMLGLLTRIPDEKILRFTFLLKQIGALEFRPPTAKPVSRPAPKPLPPKPEAVAPPPDPPAPPPPAPPAPVKAPQPQAPIPVVKERKLTFEEALTRPGDAKTQKDVKVPKPSEKAELSYQKAEKEYDEKNYGKAAYYCKEALLIHQDAKYYHLLGAACARHPRFQKDAEEAFHKAILMSPLDPDYHAILAAFYFQRELWIRARTHCEKALDLSAVHKMANEISRKLIPKALGKGECWCVRGDKPPE